MTVRDSITRARARTPGAEDYPTSKAAHVRALSPTQCGITEVATTCAKGRHKPNNSRCMPGAGLSWLVSGKVLPYTPAFQPYRGKPAVRNDREGRGNVGIIRSPVRASTLPDSVIRPPKVNREPYVWFRTKDLNFRGTKPLSCVRAPGGRFMAPSRAAAYPHHAQE
jgi:hypothetical protein